MKGGAESRKGDTLSRLRHAYTYEQNEIRKRKRVSASREERIELIDAGK